MNIQALIERFMGIIERHRLEEGVYARYLWQDEKGSRKMGINEYGCADAANILYTVGHFPRENSEREKWVGALRGMQSPETGLFHEETHHPIHTTAHCTAALELFDARPEFPFAELLKYLDRERLYAFLDGLDWEHSPWNNSHQGAGLYAAMKIAGAATPEWEKAYFEYLWDRCDPETGMGLAGRHGSAPLFHQLNGWFHYLFNHVHAKRPFPHAERLIDTCIDLYKGGNLAGNFARMVGFSEIDWVFAMNRAVTQTGYRFSEVKSLLLDMAQGYIDYLMGLDPGTDDGLNDLHMLFGAVCCLSELQIALPGQIETDVPMKNVLDRRPFI